MTSHSNITLFILTPNRHSTIFYINLPIGFNCSFSEGTKMPFEPILTSVYNCASKMLKKSYRWEDSLDLRIILEMLRFMQLYMHLAVKVFILIYLSPISILLYVIHLLSAFVSDMYHHSESKRKLFKKTSWWKEVGFFPYLPVRYGVFPYWYLKGILFYLFHSDWESISTCFMLALYIRIYQYVHVGILH